MAIVNQLKLAALQTTFDTLAAQAFGTDKTNRYGIFSRTAKCDGQSFSPTAMGSTPAVREIVGSRRWASLRGFANSVPVKRWGPDGIELPILQINNDPGGLLEQNLKQYLDTVTNFYEKPATDFLLTNPTSLYGGALLSDTQSFGYNGNTWDNLGAALSPTEFFTGIKLMNGLWLENGEPAGVYPDVLMVGPDNQKMASDLVSSDRVVPIAATGLEAYSSAVAVSTRSNFAADGQQPTIRYVVNPRFNANGATASGAAWFFFDTRQEARRPIVVGEAIAPSGQIVIDPSAPAMIDRSAAQAYVEGQAGIAGAIPFATYGYIA